jgi:hypothetical protein
MQAFDDRRLRGIRRGQQQPMAAITSRAGCYRRTPRVGCIDPSSESSPTSSASVISAS